MVLNVSFNNISVISWWSGLLVEKTGILGENRNTQRKQEYSEKTGILRENRNTQRKRKQEYSEKTTNLSQVTD